MHVHSRDELLLMLKRAGFTDVIFHGGYAGEGPDGGSLTPRVPREEAVRRIAPSASG
jgi:hypothetical protein